MSRSGTRRSRWTRTGSTGWWKAHDSAPEENLDATDDPIHGQQEGRFFHGYYRTCYLPLYIFSGEHLLAPGCSNIDGAAGGGTGTDRAGFGRAGGLDRHPGRLGLLLTCSAGVKTITWIT